MKKNTFCVVTCVKNEGPFLLEWIAYCKGIGVTDFLIFSNDCDDLSAEILDRLDDLGVVRHLPNPTGFMNSSQHHRTALTYAPLHKEFQRADYIVIIDCDEFIFSKIGDGTLQSLVTSLDEPDIISLSELNFGFGHNLEFRDGLVTQQFRRSRDKVPPPEKPRRGVKSIVRRTDKIKEFSNHRPVVDPKFFNEIKWYDGSGKPMPMRFVKNHKRGINCQGRYEKAWLNHYTLRSGESMLAKLERGDAVRQNRLDTQYFKNRDGKEAEYSDIDANLDATQAELDRLKSDKTLADLHEKSVLAHKAKIEKLKSDPKFKTLWQEIVETVHG
ncbi:glycosyltransferase family 2 protein [Celeribacter halophilus]|jgi:hypothetical protein|uniref:glycosyltransferase family 2 protein n=1 Tax=Celeribacter halophilus TaxID=576117 RepID=UPI0026E2CEC6|nr:glycosyltransferase family 2 protein [Celeribacter halophilus]MDO6724747.1 glycosyltransferase family 2 protein [Celeribacter halophilus]